MRNIVALATLIIFFLAGCHDNDQSETEETGAENMINQSAVHNEIKQLMKSNAEAHNANLPLDSEDSIEQIAHDAIISKLPENIKNNIRYLRGLHDEEKNRYWLEFYDTESFISFLWLGFVVIEGDSLEILHTDADWQFYSGVSPEMAAGFRAGGKEAIENEYGSFQIENDG